MFQEDSGDSFPNQAWNFTFVHACSYEQYFPFEALGAETFEKIYSSLLSEIKIEQHDVDFP